MKRNNALVLFITLILLIGFTLGCDEEVYGDDRLINPEKLEKEQLLSEDTKVVLKELGFLAPRTAHDYNLKIIDKQIELYKLLEGKEPNCIGEIGESGTLVGDGYLKKNPPIPVGLREDTGEWSAYRLGGKPLRALPVGNWEGAYR